jgi:hypothetical protein
MWCSQLGLDDGLTFDYYSDVFPVNQNASHYAHLKAYEAWLGAQHLGKQRREDFGVGTGDCHSWASPDAARDSRRKSMDRQAKNGFKTVEMHWPDTTDK